MCCHEKSKGTGSSSASEAFELNAEDVRRQRRRRSSSTPKAFANSSPGWSLRQPWENVMTFVSTLKALAASRQNPRRLTRYYLVDPGLCQPWENVTTFVSTLKALAESRQHLRR